MRWRPAITLIEVLVATFVAAIGALSLLVLFPLGALNISQGLRDDRCAQAATNAAALADAGVWAGGTIYPYRTDPNITAKLLTGKPAYVDALAINVMGVASGLGGLGGTAPATAIPRVAPSTVATNVDTYKRFRLHDDLTYDANGQADTSTGTYINRAGQYTWAYLVRPPGSINPNIADLAIVVYVNRSVAQPKGESFYTPTAPASGTVWPVGSTSITISYPGTNYPGAPPLRRGNWIVDASASDTSTGGQNDPPDIGKIHSFFYRVTDIFDTGSSLVLDLQTPLVAAINGPTVTAPSVPGVIVVLQNVAHVYERRTGWQP
jgi:hypothetical protein